MNHKYAGLHTANMLFRIITWLIAYVGIRYMNIMPAWLATIICFVCIILEMVVHHGYMVRDRQNDRDLTEKIATMPLYELAEAINMRDDIKKIVINEAEEE